MNWRENRVALGAVVFFVLLGLTVWAISTRDRAPAAESGQIPTVEIDKDAITSIEVKRPKDEMVVLSKVDEEWRITAPLDAEPDPNNVQSALNRLGDLRLTGIVATRPENYARLEVDGPQAVSVVAKSGEETLIQLWVGKYSNGTTMVRVDDHPEVFGVSGSFRFPFDRDLKTWRNRRIVDVKASDVQAVIFQSDKGTFRFKRDAGSWVPSKEQKPIEAFDPKKVEGLVSTAARLTASDFASMEISTARAGLTEPGATVTLTVAPSTEGEGAEGAAPAEAETIILELGDNTDKDTELYLRRKDDPTIYIISKYLADRLRPDAKAFEQSEEPPPPPPAMPGAQGMPPGQQQPQLPPEVMRQLQEQIRQQQQQQQR